ncbi:hypothetical protein SAMD00019534_031600 [Acytostelium subglobosum LB1]|uniref:hypothetical protein n=1 Tax=Acytostelium subglobosum LB1 TaxID=1410327 RepID=UPI000644BD82|nr:hypothetical protein SAMD00019534_031600 [Acytostelium subglobosum LB1]GAM19985.1 hypothetical protein SAMD00019534_031600 [Acytostelium subglobosum LB1]|eukprot:XP_012756747.1 hypothetical protein SAMD00019534_031600 [Acytostelium subglobosum LB1]
MVRANVLYSSFIIFTGLSIALFMVSELIKDDCPNSELFHKLMRACGIIDVVFLGVFLIYIISVGCSSASTKKMKPGANQHVDDLEMATKKEEDENNNNNVGGAGATDMPIEVPKSEHPSA